MNPTLVEEKFGHGAIIKDYDIRDHKVSNLGMAQIPFDWNIGFDITQKVRSIITENQNGSFSCGGQAARYYLGVLKALETGTYERLSAKDPYCQIFYPGGGTQIGDIGKICVSLNRGIRNESLVPSYQNGQAPTEWFMEDKTVSNVAPLKFFRVEAFAYAKTDIDSIARSIRDNNGCIIQINGEDNGTWLSTYPKPPLNTAWRHFLYAGKALVINGIKHIGVLNSWGSSVGDQGWQYLSEDYFNGNVTNALVFYDPMVAPHNPTPIQTSISYFPAWVVRLVNWLGGYIH